MRMIMGPEPHCIDSLAWSPVANDRASHELWERPVAGELTDCKQQHLDCKFARSRGAKRATTQLTWRH